MGGILLNKKDNTTTVLRLNHSIGRSRNNMLNVNKPDVSKTHASLYWLQDSWYIKDHSSNGTLLNNTLLVHEAKKIKKGDIIQFGKDESTVFTMERSEQPGSFLSCKYDPSSVIVLKEATHFPSERPKVSFFKRDNTLWYLDDGVEEKHLVDEEEYTFCDRDWIFIENEPLEDTLVHKEVSKDLIFEFYLSADQESVSLILSSKETKCDLGQRIHNHLLLILARQKSNDLKNRENENVAGWIGMELVVEKLKKELMQPNIDQYYVNLMIHRIRKQLSKDLPFTANISDVIERSNGKLRFRYNNISIQAK